MKSCQLVLDHAEWIVKNFDGTITRKYNEINRDILDTFELHYKKLNLVTAETKVFRLKTNGKTLIHRLKTQSKANISVTLKNSKTTKIKSSPLKPISRIRITALLKRNQNISKNKSYGNYSFDPEISEIHYIFEDGTIQKRNDFGDKSPYLPLELFPEELQHLMKGV